MASSWSSGLAGNAGCAPPQPEPLVDESALSPVLRRLHDQVQRAFDPQGVFATGRLMSL